MLHGGWGMNVLGKFCKAEVTGSHGLSPCLGREAGIHGDKRHCFSPQKVKKGVSKLV
jgi:hypothetical protein